MYKKQIPLFKLNVVIWLKTMKMMLKLKNKSHTYNINSPRARHGHGTRTSTYRATYFPYCTKEWNQLNDDKKFESIKKFKKKTLVKVIRTQENSVWVSDIYGTKVLTRLRLNFSHLNEHKFRQNFNDTVNHVQLWCCYWNNYSLPLE